MHPPFALSAEKKGLCPARNFRHVVVRRLTEPFLWAEPFCEADLRAVFVRSRTWRKRMRCWVCLQKSMGVRCVVYSDRSFWIYQKYAYIVEKTPPKIIGETRLWLHTNLGNRGFILLEFFVHEVSPRSIARSCCISGIGFAAALSALMMGLWIGGKLLVPNLGSWKKSLAFAPSCFFFFFVSLPTFVLLFYFLRYANLDFLFAEVLDVNRSVHHGYSASGWSISLKGCRCIKCRVVEPLCILSPSLSS